MPEKVQKVKIVGDQSMPHKSPSFLSLDAEDLPAIKDWNVGKKYTIMLEVEQVSMSKDGDEYGPVSMNDKKPMMRARFKILKAKVPGDDKPASRQDKIAKLKQKAEEY